MTNWTPYQDQKVLFDTDLDALCAGILNNGVITGCDCTGAGTDMYVDVSAGLVIVDGTRTTVTAADIQLTAGDATYDRWDLVTVNSSGTLGKVDGTPAANPSKPDYPSSTLVLCSVLVPQNATTISTSDITEMGRAEIRPPEQTSSFIIFTDGTTTYAKNGTTGKIDYSGTTASTVIQNALDVIPSYGGRVLIKKGSYTLSASLQIPGRTTIEGEAITSEYDSGSRLILASGVNDDIIKNKANEDDIEIIRLHLEGNKGNQTATSHGIDIDGGGIRIMIKHCHFNQIRDNAMNMLAQQAQIMYCYSDNVDGKAIYIQNSDCFVGWNDLYSAGTVIEDNGGDNIIMGNNCFLGGGIGIFLNTGGDKSTVIGNRVNHCTSYGIKSTGQYCVIVGNRLDSNGAAAIFCNCPDNNISYNNIYNNDAEGIYIADTSGKSVINGNIVKNNDAHGIYVLDASYTVIDGNCCMNNGQTTTGDGIHFDYYSVTFENVICSNNICCDDQGTPTQRYGILIDTTTDYFLVRGNICRGNATANLQNNSTGTNNDIGNNIAP